MKKRLCGELQSLKTTSNNHIIPNDVCINAN